MTKMRSDDSLRRHPELDSGSMRRPRKQDDDYGAHPRRLCPREPEEWHTLHRRHVTPLQRWWQHRSGELNGFTKRYGVTRLVHVEFLADMTTAIAREKQLKAWRRAWKIALIEKGNPGLRNLAVNFGLEPITARRASRMDAESSSA